MLLEILAFWAINIQSFDFNNGLSSNVGLLTACLWKLIVALLFNYIIAHLFLMNFKQKHKKVWNLNFNIDKKKAILLFVIVFFILLFIWLVRIIIRHTFLIYFFQNTHYISLWLSIIWLLPFGAYLSNLGTKYLKNKVKKEDYYLFNDNVAKSVNVFSITFISLLIYINVNYYWAILEIIYYNLDKFYKTNLKLNITPQECFEIFQTEKGGESFLEAKDKTTTKSNSYLENLMGKGKNPNLYFRIRTTGLIWNSRTPINNLAGSEKGSVIKQLLKYQKKSQLVYDKNSFTVSKNTNFTSGMVNVKGHTADDGKGLVIAVKWAKDTNSISSNDRWYRYDITNKQTIKIFQEKLQGWGVNCNNVDFDNINYITLHTPYSYKNFETRTNNCYQGYPNSTTQSFLTKINDHTHIKDLDLPIELANPTDKEFLFTTPYNHLFRSRYSILNNAISPIDRQESSRNEGDSVYFSNKNFSGRVFKFFERSSFYVVEDRNTNDFFKTSIVNSNGDNNYYFSATAWEANVKLGLDINLDNRPRQLDFHTQGYRLFPEAHHFFEVPLISKYCHVIDNKEIILGRRNIRTLCYDVGNGYYPHNFFDTFRCTLGSLDSDNNLDIKITNLLEEVSTNSIFDEIFRFPYYRWNNMLQHYFNNNHKNVNMFRIDDSSQWLVLCKSNKLVTEERLPVLSRRINPMLKDILLDFVKDPQNSSAIHGGDMCGHTSRKLNVIFWDNFCVEFGTINSLCRQGCESYDNNSTYPETRSIIFKYSEQNYQQIFNLFDEEDQQVFFRYLNRIYPSHVPQYFFLWNNIDFFN
jgi:hypothetical protein